MKKTLGKLIASPYFSFAVTLILFVILYGAGIAMYKGFMRPQVFFNLFIDNAALIIVAVGITFTLIIAGMFFCRGMTAVISQDTIQITNPTWVAIASYRINLGVGFLSVGAVIALLSIIIAAIVLGFTKFGRAVYAVGGSESSAALMGLPVFRTKVMVYTISGFCSALGGIAYSLIMLTGYNLHGLGMEMDAIASSVIGGTLLTGGVGFIPGALVGVLIQGVILTFISFQGTLSAWWTKIVVGALLCVFIIMQAFITEFKAKLSSKSSMENKG